MDNEEHLQRLKAAVHYTVGQLCKSIGEDHDKTFSRHVIAAIAETTFRQCDTFAKDLEAFARHAKRNTVSVEDVRLAARRSTSLSNFIQRKSEELANSNQEQRDKREASRWRKHDGDMEVQE